jgi:hypothetical protein
MSILDKLFSNSIISNELTQQRVLSFLNLKDANALAQSLTDQTIPISENVRLKGKNCKDTEKYVSLYTQPTLENPCERWENVEEVLTDEGVSRCCMYPRAKLNEMDPRLRKFQESLRNGTVAEYCPLGGLDNILLPNTLTKMGNYAFSHKELASVDLPDTLTWVSANSFISNKLTSIDIPNNVRYIGENAFRGNLLRNVTLGENLEFIGDYAFSMNRIEEVTIPDRVGIIGIRSFAENRITSAYLGESIRKIGHSAFIGNQLTEVVIPASVGYIDSSAFRNNKLSSVEFTEGIEFIRDNSFRNNQLTSVTIPNGVRGINAGAFMDNPELRSFNIPDSVLEVNDAVDWSLLEKLEIGPLAENRFCLTNNDSVLKRHDGMCKTYYKLRTTDVSF